MCRFLIFVASIYFAALGVQAGDPAQCVPVDWQKTTKLVELNALIDMAVSSGLIPMFVPEPIVVTNKRLDAIDFTVLGVNFALTPIIQSLTASGVNSVNPYHFNATSATNLDAGAIFNNELSITTTMTFEIAQLNHQWWQICWTNLLNPAKCPPVYVTADLAAAATKFSALTNINLAMVECPASDPTCVNYTLTDIIIDAYNQRFTNILTRLTRRIKTLSMATLNLGFDQITKLNLNIQGSGSLISEIIKLVLQATVTEVNKKGVIYTEVIAIADLLFKTLVNSVITEKFGPSFAGNCYDA